MAPEAGRKPDTILVVDDDEELQRLLRLAFEARGFRVEKALDGLAAVDFLKAHRVDLTVLDLFLPSMDGWAVLEQMKCFPRRPPVVVISGASEVNVTPRVFREGVEAFIAKPFQLGTLINTCAELIARAKGGRAPTLERRRRGARRTLTLPVTVRDGDDRLLHAGRLLNLSVLGAQVELPAPLAPGQRVRLAYSADQGAPLVVEGCVQWWQHPDRSSPATSVGISFTGVTAEQQRRIKQIAALE